MKRIEFTVFFPQIPKGTSQMKRVNHRSGRFFEGKELQEARAAYEDRLRPFAPDQPFDGPVKVSIGFGYFVKNIKLRGKPKTSRPDADNLVKLVLDVMTKIGYWNDDSQIVELTIMKHWAIGNEANLYVHVREVVE